MKIANERQIMVFDLDFDGHHANYIQHLIEYWCQKKLLGNLYIVVSPEFAVQRPQVAQIAQVAQKYHVHLVPITKEEQATLRPKETAVDRKLRNFQEWGLLYRYALQLKAVHCVVMYLDTFFFSLACGVNAPCDFSGIYFRPTFHYDEFANYLPSKKERIQQWLEKLILSRVLSNPKLKTLLCLDPFVVKHLKGFRTEAEIVHLPDPVLSDCTREIQENNLGNQLKIAPDKKVFLLFGSLSQRKGIFQLLQSIELLPVELCPHLCLLLVGQTPLQEQTKIDVEIERISRSYSVQIIKNYQYISEADVRAYFQLADVVLAPYQNHVGMSGILLLAASNQKPVLSTDYGLMGEVVRRYQLGLTVNSTIPREIARGITQFIRQSPDRLCDFEQMKTFAEQNSVENFARTIFQHL